MLDGDSQETWYILSCSRNPFTPPRQAPTAQFFVEQTVAQQTVSCD